LHVQPWWRSWRTIARSIAMKIMINNRIVDHDKVHDEPLQVKPQ
jgi:hypothetical protein